MKPEKQKENPGNLFCNSLIEKMVEQKETKIITVTYFQQVRQTQFTFWWRPTSQVIKMLEKAYTPTQFEQLHTWKDLQHHC